MEAALVSEGATAIDILFKAGPYRRRRRPRWDDVSFHDWAIAKFEGGTGKLLRGGGAGRRRSPTGALAPTQLPPPIGRKLVTRDSLIATLLSEV